MGGTAHAPSKIHNGALFKKYPFSLMKESLEVSFPHSSETLYLQPLHLLYIPVLILCLVLASMHKSPNLVKLDGPKIF